MTDIPPTLRWLRTLPVQVSHEGGHDVVGPIAYASDHAWGLIAHNQAFADSIIGPPPANMFHWLARDGRQQLPDHEREWLGMLLPRLRALLDTEQSPALDELKTWCETTPGVREAWTRSDERSTRPGDGDILPFIHPLYGEGTVEVHALAAPAGANRGLRVVLSDFHVGATVGQVCELRMTAMDRSQIDTTCR